VSWSIDVTNAEPFEPQDSWAGGAGEEPDDLDRRPYKRLGWPIAHVTGCRCSACVGANNFGKERSSHAPLGPTVVAATPGDSEDEPTAPAPGVVKPPFVPGAGAGSGAVPEREMDDTPTAEQCELCRGYAANCTCPKGNA
jgi:hypothetical protein